LVRKATTDDVAALVQMLSRAFDEDLYQNWVVRQDGGRVGGFRLYFEKCLELTLPFDGVYTTPECEGAAIWTPPGKWKLGFLQQLLFMRAMVRTCGLRRVPEMLRGLKLIQDRHPSPPHYYLDALGVDPRRQAQGIGARLLGAMLRLCDREQVGAYLETSEQRNVAFFQRFGFDVAGHLDLPAGPRLWLMWRDTNRPA
jgi:N-acetylglutamate synthase-like GNAT family acetyltransferase